MVPSGSQTFRTWHQGGKAPARFPSHLTSSLSTSLSLHLSLSTSPHTPPLHSLPLFLPHVEHFHHSDTPACLFAILPLGLAVVCCVCNSSSGTSHKEMSDCSFPSNTHTNYIKTNHIQAKHPKPQPQPQPQTQPQPQQAKFHHKKVGVHHQLNHKPAHPPSLVHPRSLPFSPALWLQIRRSSCLGRQPTCRQCQLLSPTTKKKQKKIKKQKKKEEEEMRNKRQKQRRRRKRTKIKKTAASNTVKNRHGKARQCLPKRTGQTNLQPNCNVRHPPLPLHSTGKVTTPAVTVEYPTQGQTWTHVQMARRPRRLHARLNNNNNSNYNSSSSRKGGWRMEAVMERQMGMRSRAVRGRHWLSGSCKEREAMTMMRMMMMMM